MPLISALSLSNRFTQLLLIGGLLLVSLYFFLPALEAEPGRHPHGFSWTRGSHRAGRNHTIDGLVSRADTDFADLISKETHNVHDAAKAYRERRGRQPPPGFDVWFRFAQNQSALIVEEFFDQIYHDLSPFWGLSPRDIREYANVYTHRISVRKGNATKRTDVEERAWLDLWHDMVGTFVEFLPDLDIAINEMDESRVVVPYEEVEGYMKQEEERRRIVSESNLKDEYSSLEELEITPPGDKDFGFVHEGHYWEMARIGCPPESPARQAEVERDYGPPPPLPTTQPAGSLQGYVQNWTLARSPCENSHLQGLHGTFVEPVSLANTKKLIPLFGGSKLPMNNEILLPPAMYWTKDPFYSGGKEHGVPWPQKKDAMIWRGAASGGRNKEENWTRFQRHRFVAMTNATSVASYEANSTTHPPNFVLPARGAYNLASQPRSTSKPSSIAAWLAPWADAAVVHLLCFPGNKKSDCPYTAPYFSTAHETPMADQYRYKYLPDIDGNSFSGRYRGFLGSTSVPIKATIYHEWHDQRLVPWKHFVPMDNTFIDFYGIMEYFLGNAAAGVEGHDGVAERIALDGKQWAERVLRREDMQVYVFRLLLEYARVCRDEREILGWKEGPVDEQRG